MCARQGRFSHAREKMLDVQSTASMHGTRRRRVPVTSYSDIDHHAGHLLRRSAIRCYVAVPRHLFWRELLFERRRHAAAMKPAVTPRAKYPVNDTPEMLRLVAVLLLRVGGVRANLFFASSFAILTFDSLQLSRLLRKTSEMNCLFFSKSDTRSSRYQRQLYGDHYYQSLQ